MDLFEINGQIIKFVKPCEQDDFECLDLLGIADEEGILVGDTYGDYSFYYVYIPSKNQILAYACDGEVTFIEAKKI